MTTTDEGAPLSFATDIKPMFRKFDRDAMVGTFDLWEHADVTSNAEAILEAVRDGSMPCDDAWSEDRVVIFERWVIAGSPE